MRKEQQIDGPGVNMVTSSVYKTAGVIPRAVSNKPQQTVFPQAKSLLVLKEAHNQLDGPFAATSDVSRWS